jgi:hypothetical protein
LNALQQIKGTSMPKGIAGLAAVLAVAGPVSTSPILTSPVLAQEDVAQESPRQENPRPNLPQGIPHQDIPRQDVFRQGWNREDGHHRRRLSQADLNALTDARIASAKAMLQMTPEQTKLWPPVEEAMRDGAEARYRRIAQLQAMAERAGERDPDPVALMRSRADALSERATRLRRLADAWQPLYQTLNAEQRDRLRLIASLVLHETSGALAEWRHAENTYGAEEGEEE